MSFTLVTGLPGAGKTLFTIDKLLRPLVGRVDKRLDSDGVEVAMPRTIFTNIAQLNLPHELIEADGPMGLNNWHEWAKPGDVICWDEIQRPWPLTPNGSKVPQYLAELETHRHKGVDFICMTQKPSLVHKHVIELADKHLHVRRMANAGFAIVYEWDGVSRTLNYKSALSRKPYRYNKAVYQLYHSADAHTKQTRSLPTALFGLVFAVAAFAYFGPKTYANIMGKAPPAKAVQVAQSKPAPVPLNAASGPLYLPLQPVSSMSSGGTHTGVGGPLVPAFSGCAQVRNVCKCFDARGTQVQVMPEVCTSRIEPAVPPLPEAAPFFRQDPIQLAARPEDLDVLRFMGKHRGRAANNFFPY